MKCPCYKCEDRQVFEHATCHATCQKYKEWKERMEKRKTIMSDAEVRDYILDSIERNRRLKNAKNSH